jgi:hypothetical protein
MVRQSLPALIHFLAALALFAVLAIVSGFPTAARIDRTITVAIQDTLPDVARPAGLLVHLANVEIVIPALAAIGLAFLFFGDARHGMMFLLLAIAALGLSVIEVVFKHVIVHPGPAGALRLHVRRPMALSGVSIGDAIAFFALVAASGFSYVLLRGEHHGPVSVWPMVTAFSICVAIVLLMDTGRRLFPTMTAGMDIYTQYGYPSGHTMRAVLVVRTALRRAPALGAAIVAAMAVSLIYVGDHSMSEVLGGLCLGWAGAEVVWGIWRYAGMTGYGASPIRE